MGITGLLPFIEKASRRVNVSEFNGCTVAIDSYCWLHKGAFACADKIVRGEETDIHIKYCLKYVNMLLSKNIKPILVFDGRHLPAKAMTESKRRESRDISKKRAAELLSLGKVDEARSYMRRSVDITHAMALSLIKECRRLNVDCIVAPYEADSQLAYLNIKNIAHVVITEDSDLVLFGCTKVLFKMDLDGNGTLVETAKLPLVMKCPIEHYTFDKFRQMCIMSGCDYLSSLPGIGLAKARQFVTATRESNFANALRKLPSFFNKSNLTVTDEYRESFLKAEATFKHQYVYDPLVRQMVRLTEPDDEDIEQALCVNAGELLDAKIAFELALGNLDPFTLNKMDDWHPDYRENTDGRIKTSSWKNKGVSTHPSIWNENFKEHLSDPCPWQKKVKKVEPIIAVPQTRPKKKIVNLVSKYIPETEDQSLTIENLSNMYCMEPVCKKPKSDNDFQLNQSLTQFDTQGSHNVALHDDDIIKELETQKEKSPILENKQRSFKKCSSKNGSYSILKRLSKFPRTVLDDHVVESKFFNSTSSDTSTSNCKESIIDSVNDNVTVEESPDKLSRNPFKVKLVESVTRSLEINTDCIEIPDSQFNSSQKENSPQSSPVKCQRSPILEPSSRQNNQLRILEEKLSNDIFSQESVIENTYPLETLITPLDSQSSFGSSPPKSKLLWKESQKPIIPNSQPNKIGGTNSIKRSISKAPVLKRTTSLPSNQPTLLSKFGFQKKPVLKR
ncbi:exonuclease 1 [Achroia grisella]|uniref:exonuclease 1 n=1 Tax=Achroia grisella TaxID=688607 RepID=UPI0027D2B32F|nr:exonuclease 1 [Achroia grisella]